MFLHYYRGSPTTRLMRFNYQAQMRKENEWAEDL